jgi:hypothetical protein
LRVLQRMHEHTMFSKSSGRRGHAV